MTLLATRGLEARYGDFQALFGIDLDVEEGETVAIIGANGAGKSTFLRTIAGMLATHRDAIIHRGVPVGGLPARNMVSRGISLVPEGRRLFPSLSVEENLLMGRLSGRRGPWNLQRVYQLFPDLIDLRRRPGTALSGGQQQMVAIGRGLMANPEILLCDEISLGLAPIVVRDIYAAMPGITAEGATLVIVEQNLRQALAVAQRIYCFREGRVTLSGRPAELDHAAITAAYFGS